MYQISTFFTERLKRRAKVVGLIVTASLCIHSPSYAQTPPNLHEKLHRQWHHYNEAKTLLQSKLPDADVNAPFVSDEEWHDWLYPIKADTLDEGDLATLKTLDNKTALKHYREDKNHSLLSLDKLRNEPLSDTETFCAALPKGGLIHIHPTGTATIATAKAIILNNPGFHFDLKHLSELSGLTAEETNWLQGLNQALGNNPSFAELASSPQFEHFLSFYQLAPIPPANTPYPFSRFQAIFGFVDILVQAPGGFDTIITDFVARAARQHVSYVELATSLSASPQSPKYIGHITELTHQLKERYGVTIRFNYAFHRTSSVAGLQQKTNYLINELLPLDQEKIIVGIDFVGDETNTPAFSQGQVPYLSVLLKTHLHRTMHAGELGNLNNTRDAMLLGAERLGHAVLLASNVEALQYARKKHIPVEINLTSNAYLTKGMQQTKNHPFLLYTRLGLPTSLSTDDEGMFNTDINHECIRAIRESTIQYSELKQMSYNGIKTAFVDDNKKEALIVKLDKQFVAFEQSINTIRQAHKH